MSVHLSQRGTHSTATLTGVLGRAVEDASQL